MSSTETTTIRSKLATDFASAMSEAQEILHHAAVETGEKARDLRAQVENKLLQAKLRLQEIEGHAVERARTAARATDDYVHDHPWRAVGAAAVAGILIGLLMNRR